MVGALALAGFPATAPADSISSENWSGYAAHGRRAVFRTVTGTWRQPAAVCPGDYPTFSATWVGLGGYRIGATSLEQIGTELDCEISGQARVSAWYELVPALPKVVPITIRPGDLISAGVTVSGGLVSLRLVDRTLKQTFSRTVRPASVDVSSADWILEAPTECDPYGNCLTLQLADFGSVRFIRASARTTDGNWGSIASPLWRRTRITLFPDPYYYAADDSAAVSTPSLLRRGGTSFEIDYQRTAGPGPLGLRAARAAAGRTTTVNPGGRRQAG